MFLQKMINRQSLRKILPPGSVSKVAGGVSLSVSLNVFLTYIRLVNETQLFLLLPVTFNNF